MESIDVSSSFIERLEWDEVSLTLTVHFKIGRTAVYHNVPREVFVDFGHAASPGRFFNERIKGVYG